VNTNTGRVYDLGDDVAEAVYRPHEFLTKAAVEQLRSFDHPDGGDERTNLLAGRALGRQLTHDEQAALADSVRGEPIVPVSGDVAQKVRLGARELERRRKRSKAARESRKRNRG
jgi:hypothetical protein